MALFGEAPKEIAQAADKLEKTLQGVDLLVSDLHTLFGHLNAIAQDVRTVTKIIRADVERKP